MTLTIEEYRAAFRWAMLRLLDYELGSPLEPTPQKIQRIISDDAIAQVQGE